jgi:hypothetical protein
MAADSFFNRKISKVYRNRVAKERFTLTPKKAYDKLYYLNSKKKYYKPLTTGIEFTERQLQIATKALKGTK